ncbi:MAG: hypothetical protein [Microviridae sp.]|nr:MAG: hypothetical protein [Microviridae sp.]
MKKRRKKTKNYSKRERVYHKYHKGQTLFEFKQLRKKRKIRDDYQKKRRIPNDEREFRPDGQGTKYTDGRPVEYNLRDGIGTGYGYSQTNARLGFRNPKKVSICRRRARRRETLFRRGRAGRGIAGPKLKYKNEYSNIRC